MENAENRGTLIKPDEDPMRFQAVDWPAAWARVSLIKALQEMGPGEIAELREDAIDMGDNTAAWLLDRYGSRSVKAAITRVDFFVRVRNGVIALWARLGARIKGLARRD